MKTYKNLFDKVCDFKNLYVSFKKARRGKQSRPNINAFSENLESELIRLEEELRSGTYRPVFSNVYFHEGQARLYW